MNRFGWIKASGTLSTEDLPEHVKNQEIEGMRFLLYKTGAFHAGFVRKENLSGILDETVLELRIFSEKKELYYCRSYIGEDFQWRIASEEAIQSEQFIVQYQTLDINDDMMADAGNGNMILCTTVGGHYELPIKKGDNSTKIIAYLNYDRYGMAKIVDYRICGFCFRDKKGGNA